MATRILFVVFVALMIALAHGDCGWFAQKPPGEEDNEIFGTGYCFVSQDYDESFMYDCENGIIYELRWDDNIGCEGEPTTNTTDGTCTDPLLCNCVSAEESDCAYIEYKIYPSSSCSGEYSSNSQVLNECYRSYDG